MNDLQFFVACVALSFCAWAFTCRTYFWPWPSKLPLAESVGPILVLHTFRFVGAAFMIPGVASPTLPSGLAAPAAYGDLVAFLLAWLTLLLKGRRLFVPALWVFNTWGALDLLFAFFQGLFGIGIQPSSLAATFFIPTVYVPLLLCTHVIVFILLFRKSKPHAGSGEA
jgi:hypothetical protein